MIVSPFISPSWLVWRQCCCLLLLTSPWIHGLFSSHILMNGTHWLFYIAVENCPYFWDDLWWFTHGRTWFSMATLNQQRVWIHDVNTGMFQAGDSLVLLPATTMLQRWLLKCLASGPRSHVDVESQDGSRMVKVGHISKYWLKHGRSTNKSHKIIRYHQISSDITSKLSPQTTGTSPKKYHWQLRNLQVSIFIFTHFPTCGATSTSPPALESAMI